MIRVLNVMGWGLRCGGMETRVMNYYRHIDRTKFQFDFLMPTDNYKNDFYYDEAISLGAEIYSGHRVPKNCLAVKVKNSFILKAIVLARVLIKNPGYKIIVIHHDKPKIALYTLVAKLFRVSARIVDSCSELPMRPSMQRYKPLLRATATHYMGVSERAGISLLGDEAAGKITLFKHARDIESFSYCPKRRLEMRIKLGIRDAFVMLNIGIIREEKNQTFLIDVLSHVSNDCPNAVLLIAGDGVTSKLGLELSEKANDLGLGNSVYFLGQCSDIPSLLQAADVFCFPSLYEGLGGAAIEAQSAGLPCLISDKVPPEVKITQNTTFLPINKGPDIWAEKMLEYRSFERHETIDEMRAAGYEVRDAAKWLEEYFESCLSV